MLLPEQFDKGISIEQLHTLLATPLLPAPRSFVKQLEADPKPRQIIAETEPAAVSNDFVKIEKNLISIGFFTPSSKRIKSLKSKTISLTQGDRSDKLEATATIVPAAIYGLPVTADQDKWFALHRIINNIKQENGEVQNPVTFTSTELIKLLGSGDSGNNYQEISEWLDLMSNTGIISEGAVYLAGRRNWARDRFRVFDRAVSMGKQLDDGTIADRNYIWLSAWQLENINHNYLLPIDFETYNQLKHHIAKALVPLLQVWLYATKDQGSFEKRYDDLCQILSIRAYRYLSNIKEKLGPSLNELQRLGYLSAWSVEKTSDRKAYKIVFYHGEKFHHDRLHRMKNKQTLQSQRTRPALHQLEKGTNEELLGELIKRGIAETQSRRLMLSLAEDQKVIDQIEWGDELIAKAPPGRFYNPAGLYIHLIKENVIPPPTFEGSRQKHLRLQAEQERHDEQQKRARLQLAYDKYKKREIDNYIDLNPDEYQQHVESKRQDLLGKYKNLSLWGEDTLARLVETSARAEIAKRGSFDTFEAFCEEQRSRPLNPYPLGQGSQKGEQFLTV